jgi:hypothetical protein
MNIEVGSYEAKTKLPELLRGVRLGKRYTITIKGEAIAELIPLGTSQNNEVAAAVVQMQEFINSQPPMLNIDTKALIEYGRD